MDDRTGQTRGIVGLLVSSPKKRLTDSLQGLKCRGPDFTQYTERLG